MFQTPITIAQAINKIDSNHYLLPALQREFVWNSHKIEMLFDSILRKYPIGSLLVWSVEEKTKQEQKFYQFIKNYKEKFDTHNPIFETSNISNFEAILDGQQRLTALYIGLKGSYGKLPKHKSLEIWLVDTELYLNLSQTGSDTEADNKMYDFRFLSINDIQQNEEGHWFKVSNIWQLTDLYKIMNYVRDNNLQNPEVALQILTKLHEAVHISPIINYFLEKSPDLNKALDIFIRANSGGEPLSLSDLIMSITIANWENQQTAREQLYKFPDYVYKKFGENIGFKPNKDFALKVFLCLFHDDIKFKVENFNKQNAEDLEKHWAKIKNAMLTVFSLVAKFGHTKQTLISYNALIPIIYYIFKKDIVDNFDTNTRYETDRLIIRKWLNMALLKGTFGNEGDTILKLIRDIIKTEIEENRDNQEDRFPLDKIKEVLKGRSKTLAISDDELNREILNVPKDDRYAFSILSLLYPHLDFSNKFHKDHLHPISNFKSKAKLKEFGVPDIDIEFCLDKDNIDSILNLQLLDANPNMSKGDTSLAKWVKEKNINCENQLIPLSDECQDILEMRNFRKFIEIRREILISKLKEIFN